MLADPRRDVVLQRSASRRSTGSCGDYRLYALLAPHLGNQGDGNTAWVGDYKGVADAVRGAATAPRWRSPASGPGRPLGRLRRRLGRLAGPLAAQASRLALRAGRERQRGADRRDRPRAPAAATFVLALGFGSRAAEAGHRARWSLEDGFDEALDRVRRRLARLAERLCRLDAAPSAGRPRPLPRQHRRPARPRGRNASPAAIIASLSIPWGFVEGRQRPGRLPPRLAARPGRDRGRPARRRRPRRCPPRPHFLRAPRRRTATGRRTCGSTATPYWGGMQMDEARPADPPRRPRPPPGRAAGRRARRLWPMVERAAGFLVRNGPVTSRTAGRRTPATRPFTLGGRDRRACSSPPSWRS